jgi:hypothetical protein
MIIEAKLSQTSGFIFWRVLKEDELNTIQIQEYKVGLFKIIRSIK